MGYAKYVGRVGALAVALGIGTALANPAWADTSASESESRSESPSAGSQTGPLGRSPANTPQSVDAVSVNSSDNGVDSDADEERLDGNEVTEASPDEKYDEELDLNEEPDKRLDLEDELHENLRVEEELDVDDGTEIGSDTGPVKESEDAGPEPVQALETEPTRRDQTLASTAPSTQTINRGVDHQDDAQALLSHDSAEATKSPVLQRLSTTRTADLTPGDAASITSYTLADQTPPHSLNAVDVRQPKTPIGLIFGGPLALLDIAANAINMLFSPPPDMPADQPLLLAVLAFVRREIKRTFFNSNPHAVADVASTSEGVPTLITVLGNDTDADRNSVTGAGDILSVAKFTQAAHGSVRLDANGSLTYTPNAGFAGEDTFTYTVTDETSPWHLHSLASMRRGGHRTTATVTVAVAPTIPMNHAPVARNDSASTSEGTPVKINALANDTDSDGDSLSITGITQPLHGTVAVDGGSLTYTPGADYHGSDTFSYSVSDGELSDTALVTVTVTPVNEAPLATDDTVTTAEDTPVVVDVLANDTDPDGDTLTISRVSTPGHGTAIVTDGKITYTPDTNYFGSDAFTYAVTGGSLTNTATVTVTVTPNNDAPVATDDTFTMPPDAISATFNVLSNDTDSDRDSLSVVAVTGAANGTATFSGGSVTYTPATGFTGTEVLIYTVSDGRLTDTATLTVIVPVYNAVPVAGTPAYEFTTHVGSGTVTGAIKVSDPDDDTLTFELTAGPAVEIGTVVIDPETGAWEFKPTAQARFDAWRGTGEPDTTFSVTVSDGQATTTVDVVAPIDPAVTFTKDVFDIDAERFEAQGLAIAPDGRLYVTQYLADDSAGTVTVIKPDGSIDTVIDIALVVPQAISTAYDVAIGPDGRVYVSSEVGDSWEDDYQESFRGAVVVIDPTSAYSAALFAELAEPAAGIDVDSAGRVYVGSWTTNAVTIFHPDGSVADTIHLPEPVDVATGIAGVAAGPNGRIYVTNPWQGTVTVVEPDGSIAQTIDLGGNPWSVEVGDNGAVYVTNPDTGTLTVLNQDGSIAAVASLGSESVPSDVTLGPDDRVYAPLTATDDNGAFSRITVLTPVAVAHQLSANVIGEPVAGTPGSADPVVAADGTIYLTTTSRDSAGVSTVTVTVIGTSGTTTKTDAVPGVPAGPLIIGASGTGYQTVSYRDNETGATASGVVVIPSTGQSWFTGHHPGEPAGPVVFGADGTGYQALSQLSDDGTYSTTVLVITPDGATTYTLGGFPGSSGIGAPSGPVVAPDGTVYLTVGDWVIDPDTLQAGEHTTTVAILGPSGPVTSAIAGAAGGGTGFTSDGTVYQPIYQAPAGPDTTLGTAGVAVLTDNGLVQLAGTIAGIPLGNPVIGPDGTLYQTIFSPIFDADAGTVEYTTSVAVITPAGLTPILSGIVGIPLRASDKSTILPVVVGPDGTAYQVTQNFDTATFTTSTTLAVLTATGDSDITDIAGEAVGPVLPGVNGRAFLTTYDAETDTTRVAVIAADGTVVHVIAGRPGDPGSTAEARVIVGPEGTAYQTTSAVDPDTGEKTTNVSVISQTGVVTHSIDGFPAGSIVLAPDGTVYQSVGRIAPDSGDPSTTVAVISLMGITPITHAISGAPAGPVMFGPGGSIYQVTVQTNAGTTDATSRVFVIGEAPTATAHVDSGAPENLANLSVTTWGAPSLMTARAMVTARSVAPATVGAQSALPEGVLGGTMSAASTVSTSPRSVSPIATIPTSTVFPYPSQVAVSPDGRRVYTVSITRAGSMVQQAITVVDTRSNTVKTIPVSTGYPYNAYGIALSPDGRSVYTNGLTFTGTSYQPAAFILDTVTNTVRTVPISSAYFNEVGIAVSPDGRRVYYSGVTLGGSQTRQQVLTVLDTTSNTVATIPVPHENSSDAPYFANGVTVSPDGRRVYATSVTANGSVTVTVLDTVYNTVFSIPVNGPFRAFGLAMSPDGRHAYTVGVNLDGSTAMTVLDTETETFTTFPVPDHYGSPYGYSVTVSPDGRRVYASDESGVIVFDTTTKDVTTVPITVDGEDSQIGGVAISPDGRRMYITSGYNLDGSVGQEAVLVLDTSKINGAASWNIAMRAILESISRLAPRFADATVKNQTGIDSVADLLGNVPIESPDTIRIDKIVDSVGTTRVVVYMSGVKSPEWNNRGSYIAVLRARQGITDENMANTINKAIEDIEKGGEFVSEIMLVGYSKGGMAAQNYAAKDGFLDNPFNGKYFSKVSTVITYASPLVKKADEYGSNVDVLHLEAKNDYIPRDAASWSPFVYTDGGWHVQASNPDVRGTFVDNSTDWNTVYVVDTGTQYSTNDDTRHSRQNYAKVAREYDANAHRWEQSQRIEDAVDRFFSGTVTSIVRDRSF